MSVERKNIEHILNVQEEKDGQPLQVEPALLEKLGMQIGQILNDPDHPTPNIRFRYASVKPFDWFVIVENYEQGKQILLQIRGKDDANLEAIPKSFSIRLLDRQQTNSNKSNLYLWKHGNSNN